MTKLEVQMLASNVRFYLDRLGWSGAELARRAGVPKQFVTDILSGRSPRNLKNLRQIAIALEIEGGIDALVFSDLRKKAASRKSDKTSIIDMLVDDSSGWLTGRFELKLRKLKDNE